MLFRLSSPIFFLFLTSFFVLWPAAAEETVVKKVPPLPRHILLPPVTYSHIPDIKGAYTLDRSTHRFWFILLIASWSPHSVDLATQFNAQKEALENHDVGVFALFAQNTEDDVDAWRAQNKPLFLNEFASRDFLDSVKNPEIPTAWLLGPQGEILMQLKIPSYDQIKDAIHKAFVLTNF